MGAPTKVLLVDGVGNGVVFDRARDCLSMIYETHTFEKTAEYIDGMDVYRLIEYPPATVRRIYRRIGKPA